MKGPMRTTDLEHTHYTLRITWEVRGRLPEIPATLSSPGSPAESGELDIEGCELWLHQPMGDTWGVGHQKIRVCDLLDIGGVEDWDLWRFIEPKLWQIVEQEEA